MHTRHQDKRGSQSGFVLTLFIVSMAVLLICVGLAVDLGSAYVATSRLSMSADAGALVGARHAGRSAAELEEIVRDVAQANFAGSQPASYTVEVTSSGIDTRHVVVGARASSPAFFSRLVGKTRFPIEVEAEATRYPLDVSLVLDLSYSLERDKAFDDMQIAASSFVDYFEEDVDRVGLVTYSTWAEERHALGKGFKESIKSTIASLAAISDTNLEEGLRLAKRQIDDAPERDDAVKVVVLFTDGRPTAFADELQMPSGTTPAVYDGVVAAYTSGGGYRGLFRIADGRKVRYFSNGGVAVTTDNGSSASSPKPEVLPGNRKVTGYDIRDIGAEQAEDLASAIRDAGYTIFCIGLGNPNARDPNDQPDPAFLERIANADGVSNPSQPRGESLLATSPAELDDAFARVADRILARLTR